VTGVVDDAAERIAERGRGFVDVTPCVATLAPALRGSHSKVKTMPEAAHARMLAVCA